MGRTDDVRKQQQTTKWYLNTYLHADRDDVSPLGEEVLDGLQFGGKRTYEYGTTRFKETQLVDLDALDYSRVRESERFRLEFVTLFVLESEYPNTVDVDVPWCRSVERDGLQERTEQVVEHRETYTFGRSITNR